MVEKPAAPQSLVLALPRIIMLRTHPLFFEVTLVEFVPGWEKSLKDAIAVCPEPEVTDKHGLKLPVTSNGLPGVPSPDRFPLKVQSSPATSPCDLETPSPSGQVVNHDQAIH